MKRIRPHKGEEEDTSATTAYKDVHRCEDNRWTTPGEADCYITISNATEKQQENALDIIFQENQPLQGRQGVKPTYTLPQSNIEHRPSIEVAAVDGSLDKSNTCAIDTRRDFDGSCMIGANSGAAGVACVLALLLAIAEL